jgi:DNA-binding transcriptional MerR regulator
MTTTSDERTIDELAQASGLTVRTTRYYASLGLLPPPERRGRVAFYGARHGARLELLTTLQDYGYTLGAIERVLLGIPMDATPDEISLQCSLLTAWTPGEWESLDRAEIETRVGRPISPAAFDWLLSAGSLLPDGTERFRAIPFLEQALDLHDAGFPLELVQACNESVRSHMDALAEELNRHMATWVSAQDDGGDRTPEETRRVAGAIDNLRQLAVEAIVIGFKRAHRNLMTKALA